MHSKLATFMALGGVISLGLACAAADGGGEPETDTEPSTSDPVGNSGDTEETEETEDTEGGHSTSGEEGPTDDGGTASDTEDTGEAEVPHALGSVQLGEVHSALGGSAVPIVTAVFVPDAAASPTVCGQDVEGCQIRTAPDCGDNGCGLGEYCGFGDRCQSTCQPICDAPCVQGEVCYFPSPGTPACRELERFDAGALTFTGTTTPITLFPPYNFEGKASGAPFVPGAELALNASGSTAAGFQDFDRNFTATTLIQTNLDELSVVEAYGEGPVPIEWNAGNDTIEITATALGSEGSSGLVSCSAEDAAGSFAFPRVAILAAINGEELANLSLTVQRRRVEVHQDLATQGELLEQIVQEVGWLELVTVSTESHTVEGCGFDEVVCGESCTNISSDSSNCGGCGDPCVAGDTCQGGTCAGEGACTSCFDTAQSARCMTIVDTCNANPDCIALNDCVNGCSGNRTCFNECLAEIPDGFEDLQEVGDCLCDACDVECAAAC